MKMLYLTDKIYKIKTLKFKQSFLLILAIFIMGGLNVSAQNAKGQIKIKLYFSSPDETVSDCGAVRMTTRNIPATRQTADAALKSLFKGPLNEEKAKGMQSLPRLGDFYLGVTVRQGKAIINFRPGAEKLLLVSGPICSQEQVLTPIEKTLEQFNSIKTVDYAINGKIIEDWDA